MIRDELWPRILAISIAALVTINLLLGFVAESITTATCGTRPKPSGPFSGSWLALSGDHTTYQVAGCVIPVGPIRTFDALAVVLVVALVVAGTWWWVRYRQSDAAFLADLRHRPGFATTSEVRTHLSARAVRRRRCRVAGRQVSRD
jgi:hypothetical protein